MFDAHAEIQLVYVEYKQVEPRLLEQVQQRIRSNARLDPGLMVIAGLDPLVDALTRRRRGEFAAINLLLTDLATDAPDIRNRMSSVLTSVDHYDITAPVRAASGFFGRRAERDQIIAAIERRQSVGIFGLRKAGKTSLMNLVSDLRREAGKPVVWLDISGVTGADDFRGRVLEGMFTAAKASAGEGSMPRLRTISRRGEVTTDSALVRQSWLRDVEVLAEFIGVTVELFIDEVDQLFPVRSYLGEQEAAQLFVALTQLRGMIQGARPGAEIVLVCAGVDPAIFETPLLPNGTDNLLYKLVRLHYLAPLSRDEMAEMVRDLGRRMGVRVRDYRVIDFLYAEYGGHPLLTRKACSLAAMDRPRGEVPWNMTVEAVEVATNTTGSGTPLQQAAEILESFGGWFPGEAALLQQLWSSDTEEAEFARELIQEDVSQIAHAAPYGLLWQDTLQPRIRAVKRAVGSVSR
ncbi:hypothetical protein QRX50_19935 [Amycolatopsis carbonis]|uniref:Novel STAND NTPase 1 domain-containing protein n=1 Tax=Amycolatopsis carbonis TaxID=715471 RepID=A0A9Y2IQF7_9PSEU|nr:hypothetical protein [Amycolatopsis sp. 2-15]WIX82878.1 hypothetical protein QRX50_19935 [Amycolatopsis sp. 2-15]